MEDDSRNVKLPRTFQEVGACDIDTKGAWYVGSVSSCDLSKAMQAGGKVVKGRERS
jgi:hypothetical protein